MRQGVSSAHLPLHLEVDPSPDNSSGCRESSEGGRGGDPGPSFVPGSIAGLLLEAVLGGAGTGGAGTGGFSWKGWAQSPVLLEPWGWGSFICNSGFCFWHSLEAGRTSCVATLNKNRLGFNFKSIFLLFCLNKKLAGDAWAAVNNKDAGKWPHVCGCVYSWQSRVIYLIAVHL